MAGGDAYLEDAFVQSVCERFMPSEAKKIIFAMDDDRGEDLMAELSAYSLFQTKQVLLVRQPQQLSGKVREELIKYVGMPNHEKCLILVLEDHTPGKGLHKALKGVTVIDTRPPFPDQIRSWVNDFAKDKGHPIPADALDMVITLAGDSVGHAVSELNKICSQLDEGDTITIELVRELIGSGRMYHTWHLQEALAQRKTSQAVKVLVSLMDFGANPVQLVNAMATLFMQLLFMQSRTIDSSAWTGLNKVVTKQLDRMRALYRPQETARILQVLLAADISIKSSGESTGLMIPLVVSITKGLN